MCHDTLQDGMIVEWKKFCQYIPVCFGILDFGKWIIWELFGNYLISYFLSFYFPSVFLCLVSTPSFFKDQEISERNFGVLNFPKHTAWIWISMTKILGANFDNGFIFKEINKNKTENRKKNPVSRFGGLH